MFALIIRGKWFRNLLTRATGICLKVCVEWGHLIFLLRTIQTVAGKNSYGSYFLGNLTGFSLAKLFKYRYLYSTRYVAMQAKIRCVIERIISLNSDVRGEYKYDI